MVRDKEWREKSISRRWIDIIEEIAKINPRQVVFRDSSFATDQDKVNFEERLKRLSAGTKFNVL